MSGTICMATESLFKDKREEMEVERDLPESTALEGHGWMTKQVVAACLWSAFFGLLAGYAWMFLHVSQEHVPAGNGYKAAIASMTGTR
jgi:hypothetical protein